MSNTKSHIINNAHKQVTALLEMWNCFGVTTIEAAHILTLHANVILSTDISATNINNEIIDASLKQYGKIDNLSKLEAELEAELEARKFEPIPPSVYYNPESDNFYDSDTNVGMGVEFYNNWHCQRHNFPGPAPNLIKDEVWPTVFDNKSETVPPGIVWRVDEECFVYRSSFKVLDYNFHEHWHSRRHEFPQVRSKLVDVKEEQ